MALYKNVMELLVENKLDTIYDTLDCCKCEHCRGDIVAYALNRLPTKYVVTPEGELFSKVYSLSQQHEADVISALVQSANIVKGSPRHDKP